MRRVDLADGLQLTASGVTRLLDGLEGHGLVDKAVCETDARVNYAVLTKAGRAKLEKASHSHIAAVQELFEARYTSEELETLAELLSTAAGAGGRDAVDHRAAHPGRLALPFARFRPPDRPWRGSLTGQAYLGILDLATIYEKEQDGIRQDQ